MKIRYPGQYCIDTSALIELKPYWPETFHTLWQDIERLVVERRLLAPVSVLGELEDYQGSADVILRWARRHRKMFVGLELEQQRLLRKHSSVLRQVVDPRKTKEDADPYVIVLAMAEGCAVITSERKRKELSQRMRIPDACDLLGINCLSLQDWFQKEQWHY